MREDDLLGQMVEWSTGSSLGATATAEMAGARRNRPATAKATRGRERGEERVETSRVRSI